MNLMQKMREQKLLSFSLVLFTLSLGILIGTFLDRGVLAEKEHAASGGDPLAIPSPVELSTAFTELANRLEPSVANIQTDFVRKPSETEHKFSQPGPKEFEEDDQGMELFRRFFGHMPPPRREATGSGVIVDSDGYILTNFHVVDGADRIRVKLSGEPTEYEAKMIGTDKETDLAVIKIEVPRKLVAAKIGNSDSVQVGDWAVAIGSPFGLAATVTAGIISAKERDSTEVQGAEAFQHFLQTDAAINPGNSGGPLLNINGEVIGINSAIATQVGTYQGVGFALPINMAVKVYNQLIKTGRVTRGSIGVFLEGEPKPELLKVYGAKHGAFQRVLRTKRASKRKT
jgi:serine protease Do